MLLYLETGYYNYATYLIYALPKTIDKNNECKELIIRNLHFKILILNL